MLTENQKLSMVEALLFASSDPVSVSKLLAKLKKAQNRMLQNLTESENDSTTSDQNAETLLTVDTDSLLLLQKKSVELADEISASEIKSLLKILSERYNTEASGLELVFVGGYQIRTKPDLKYLLADEPQKHKWRFSPSALETLALVAYEQPITRQKIETVRGVDSGGILKTLLDRDLIRVLGRSEDLGHPLIYGTSKKFLEVFQLQSLTHLPSLADFRSMLQTEPEAPKEILLTQLPPEPLLPAETLMLAELESSLSDLQATETRLLNTPATSQVNYD